MDTASLFRHVAPRHVAPCRAGAAAWLPALFLLLVLGVLLGPACATAPAAPSEAKSPASSGAVPATGTDLPPFAANLFQGNFGQARSAEARELAPGDRLVLRLWGDRNFDGVVMVSDAGEIDLQDLGAVPVAGLAQAQVMEAIRSKLSASGVENVQVYVSPLDGRPVSVFVTGFVMKPGRYSGAPSDSVLAFLDRAGGIDPRRGSYRTIRLLRGGAELGSFDLYPFALKGALPLVRLLDGDTIVVGEKGPAVSASGEIRNAARFEFRKGEATGAKLAEMADPLATASHASIVGTRNGAPFNLYLPLREFRTLPLADGDRVEFLADTPGDTIMVEVQGAIRGASRFPLKRTARLRDVQQYIAVDADRADLSGLYIKRRSVAARQKRAIEDALRRLEESSFTATSASPEEAQIRNHEAEMIAKFAEKARNVTPEGIVVVGSGGKVADIALEDGDVIVIPEKSDVVLVTGEVVMPQAIVWNGDRRLKDYVRGAGGYTNRADTGNILLVRPNGEVFRTSDTTIAAGDQLLVLPRVDSKNLQTVKDMSQILYQIAVATKVVIGL